MHPNPHHHHHHLRHHHHHHLFLFCPCQCHRPYQLQHQLQLFASCQPHSLLLRPPTFPCLNSLSRPPTWRTPSQPLQDQFPAVPAGVKSSEFSDAKDASCPPQGLQEHDWSEDQVLEDEEDVFVLTDEWAEFFAKSEAKRRMAKQQKKKGPK